MSSCATRVDCVHKLVIVFGSMITVSEVELCKCGCNENRLNVNKLAKLHSLTSYFGLNVFCLAFAFLYY